MYFELFLNQKVLTISKKANDSSLKKKITFLIHPSETQKLDFVFRLFCSDTLQKSIHIQSPSPPKIKKQIKKKCLIIKAAGGVVLKDNALLLIKRLHKWDLPKGKIEKNEKTLNAAKREIKEETNINALKKIQKLPSTYHMYTHKGQMVIKKNDWYLFSSRSTNTPIPQKEESIQKALFIPFSKALKNLQGSYKSFKPLIHELKKLENVLVK